MRVKYALKTTNEENLEMIFDSIAFLKFKKFEVIFDTETLDGYKNNKEYTLETVRIAPIGVRCVDTICLCKISGGMLPFDMQNIVRKTISLFPKIKFGIHVFAIERNCETYEYINPALVGNERRILKVIYLAKAIIMSKFNEMEMDIKDADDGNASEKIKKSCRYS